MTSESEPLLRTLSPLLGHLQTGVNRWLERPNAIWGKQRRLVQQATMEGLSNDLARQKDELDAESPLLIIMLMGGTGVGKSTLLNALAQGKIAAASFQRPTTRDPMVFLHESIRPERLPQALRHVKLIQHDRDTLRHKVIVDTPDLDSNDVGNRERLLAVLPVADVVLYVGSQEKYHDQIGWDLFKKQRKRRAFAFVLNKWDRCQQPSATGRKPDDDLLDDLRAEGFQEPRLFRTVAQSWLDHPDSTPPDLPEGEQFAELRDWLELGLTRLEIEALKARGVGQLLTQLQATLKSVQPPDLSKPTSETVAAWERLIADESERVTEVLLSTLDPFQKEIEHYFNLQSQHKYRGFMALYLRLTTKLRFAGSTLRDKFHILPRGGKRGKEHDTNWSFSKFAHEATRIAGEKVLDQRATAFVNRLLLEAEERQFPLGVLTDPVQRVAQADWRGRYDRALVESLDEVEKLFTHPRGWRKWMQVTLYGMANSLPEIAFVSAFMLLLWRYFMVENYPVTLADVFLPFVMTLIVIIMLQALIALLLPLRWHAVRSEFCEELARRINVTLSERYLTVPQEVAATTAEERGRIDQLIQEVAETQRWLDERQHAARIAGLYGDRGE